MSSAQFKLVLEQGDYMGMWRYMAEAFPTAPQPKTPEQAEIIMHRIRTETQSLSDKIRCYSHAWLTDRNYPSGLPDSLLPKAMRLYPRVISAVGIAVRLPKIFEAAAQGIGLAMSEGVQELYHEGKDLEKREIVHPVIFEKRRQWIKTNLGVSGKKLSDYKS